jgi:hypothetical protein
MNHVIEFFCHKMVVEIVFNNEIQMFLFKSIHIFKRKKIYICALAEKL